MAELPPLPAGFKLDAPSSAVPPLPAGFTLDQPGASQQSAPSATAQPPSAWDGLKTFISKYGPQVAPEAAASLATNMIATPIAGLAGIGTAATNALGITNTPAADVTRAVQSGLTYEPRSIGGKAVLSAASYPFEKLAQLGDAAGNTVNNAVPAIGSPNSAVSAPVSYSPGSGGWPMGGSDLGPAAAAGVSTAVQAVPSLLLDGAVPKGARAAVEAPKPVPTPREIAQKTATDAGFKLTPTQVGNKVGAVAEGMTGQAKLERSLSLKNAPRVNELAATEIGLPEGTKTITQGDLTRLKVAANKPYSELAKTGSRKVSDEFRQEVAAIGDKSGGKSFEGDTPATITNMKEFYGNITKFSAEDAVNKIRKLRRDGYANKSGKYDPEKAAIGDVQLGIADALDNELARHADTLGKPELVANYKAARVQLAKIASVENALRGSDVSALALARSQKNGAPLSGNLKTIADSASEFEKAFQEVRKIRDQNPLSVVDAAIGVGGAAATLNPALTAAVLARPSVRGFLASDTYQRRFVGSGKAKKVTPPARVKPPVAIAQRREAK